MEQKKCRCLTLCFSLLPCPCFALFLPLSSYVRVHVQIFVGEVSMYMMKSTREALLAQEKTIVTGDCCYLNPLIRRIIRFIGEKRFTSNGLNFIVAFGWK